MKRASGRQMFRMITQIITIIVGVVCGLAVFFWGGAASRLFVADPTGEIRTICNEYFHATAWCYPFLGSIFIYRNTLQGMGDGLVPMIGGIFELLARGIMVTVLAGPLGFLGICVTLDVRTGKRDRKRAVYHS